LPDTDVRPLKIMIVDDYEFTRLGLKTALQRGGQFEIIGEAANGEAALELLSSIRPDIILMDISMPKMDGVTASRHIKMLYPEIKIIILSSRQQESEIRTLLQAGVDAYCLKDITAEKLVQIIRLIKSEGLWLDPNIAKVLARGLANESGIPKNELDGRLNPDLSGRENEVLRLLCDGKANKEISNALGISIPTTKAHVSSIIQKMGVDDRTQAAVKAIRQQWV
jgi:two-component system response regulator DegU